MSPVPEDQQPLNQYRELQASGFFMWPTLRGWAFWSGVAKLWLPVLVLAGFLTASTLTLPQQWLSLGIISTCFAHGAVGLMLLRLYLGWLHIEQRLRSPQVVYEESGWYDGTIYEKTSTELTQERLVAEHQVTPVVRRLRTYLIAIGGILAAELLVWRWV